MAAIRRLPDRDAPRPLPLAALAGISLTIALTLTLAWAGMRLADPYTLPIEEVRIQGVFSNLDPARLEQRVTASVDGGFFSVDVDAVRHSLEQEPWVESVVVRRDWPNRLRVAVVERRAVARWGAEGLLDAGGRAFFPGVGTLPAGLPALSGPPGTERQVLSHYRELVERLAPLPERVVALELSERRAWSFVLASGLRVVVGRQDFDARLRRFVTHYPSTLGPRVAELGTVDLRYTNGFAVRGRPRAAAGNVPKGTGSHGEEG